MKQIKLSDTYYIVVDDDGTRTYSTLEIKGVGYYPLSLAKEIAGEGMWRTSIRSILRRI